MEVKQFLTAIGLFLLTYFSKRFLDKFLEKHADKITRGSKNAFQTLLWPLKRRYLEEQKTAELVRSDPSLRPTIMAAATYHLLFGMVRILFAIFFVFYAARMSATIPREKAHWFDYPVFAMFCYIGCMGVSELLKAKALRDMAGRGVLEGNLRPSRQPELSTGVNSQSEGT